MLSILQISTNIYLTATITTTTTGNQVFDNVIDILKGLQLYITQQEIIGSGLNQPELYLFGWMNALSFHRYLILARSRVSFIKWMM